MQNIVKGILYIEFHEQLGPNPLIVLPPSFSVEDQMKVAIKTITLLSGEEEFIPKELIMIPFPSLNLKALMRYFERPDETRRGGNALYAITILFDEGNDVIFYKYMKDFEPLFDEIANGLVEMETQEAAQEVKEGELKVFEGKIKQLIDQLKQQEMEPSDSEAFPTAAKQEAEQIHYRFKVVVCGDPAVGKTSTVLRFTDNAFKRTYMPTIGVNISEKNVKVEDTNIRLVIWDLAGTAKFDSMRQHFYENAQSILICFDLTQKNTFESVGDWYQDIKKTVTTKYPIPGFVLGNKNDLVDERQVSDEEAKTLAKTNNLKDFETSALTGENVEESFTTMAKELLDIKKLMSLQRF